jgi:predicted tellurium resistance membrane protein TerC
MHLIFDPAAWASLLTLTVLEIVLGVDNIVMLSLLTSRLPAREAQRARSAGLAIALVLRLALLSAISFIIALTEPLFAIGSVTFSWRGLILIGGGLFLIFKAIQEIHAEIEGRDDPPRPVGKGRFAAVISQIALMDLIFSLDSIITAVGLAQEIEVMAAAICIAVGIMYFAANVTGAFIERHPALKMLALAFLILIGVVLIADGFGAPLPRVYIYFAMGFAGLVEALNISAQSVANRRPAGGPRGAQGAADASLPPAKAVPLRAAGRPAQKKSVRKRARRKR